MSGLSFELDASSIDVLKKAWRSAPEAATRHLVVAATEGTLLIEREWRDRAPKGATQAYENSIAARPVDVTPERVIGTVGSSQPHALHLELGTKPHMPPIEPLVDWAKAKFGLSDREARSVGYAVALKIKAEGTEGQHLLEGTFEDNLDQIQSIFESAIQDLGRELAGAMHV